MKIPVAKLPIDVFVNNYLSFQKKKEKTGGNGAMRANAPVKKVTPREEMESLAIESGLFMIPEFQFDHCFYAMDSDSLRGSLPSEPMKALY